MQYLNWILSGFGILAGLLYFVNGKRQDAEAAVKNIKVRQLMADNENIIDADNSSLDSEKSKQDDIENQIKQIENNKDVPDVKDLETFFNRDPKP